MKWHRGRPLPQACLENTSLSSLTQVKRQYTGASALLSDTSKVPALPRECLLVLIGNWRQGFCTRFAVTSRHSPRVIPPTSLQRVDSPSHAPAFGCAPAQQQPLTLCRRNWKGSARTASQARMN